MIAGALYGGAVLVDNIITNINISIASEKLDEFDNYNYSYIFDISNDSVKSTALNTLEFYKKVKH